MHVVILSLPLWPDRLNPHPSAVVKAGRSFRKNSQVVCCLTLEYPRPSSCCTKLFIFFCEWVYFDQLKLLLRSTQTKTPFKKWSHKQGLCLGEHIYEILSLPFFKPFQVPGSALSRLAGVWTLCSLSLIWRAAAWIPVSHQAVIFYPLSFPSKLQGTAGKYLHVGSELLN